MECRASTLQICKKAVCACLARASDRYAHVEAETSLSSIIERAFAFSSFLRFTRAISIVPAILILLVLTLVSLIGIS